MIREVKFQIKEGTLPEDGIFEGVASDFFDIPDSYGDVIVKGAFSKTISQGGRNGNGIPMLWSHDSHEPIGSYPMLVEDGNTLKVTGKLAMGVQRAKEVYELIKLNIIKGLSIGWDFIRDNEGTIDKSTVEIKDGKRYLKEIELWEISPVVFPANRRATIITVKDVDSYFKLTNIRDFERFLRDEGMSHNASKYVASLCKDALNKKQNKLTFDILEAIKNIKK